MKSYLKTIIRYYILEAMRELAPGQKPKMIFLAGGAGSGKSTVLRALNARSKGYTVVDPDEAYEEGLRQHNIDLNVAKAEQEFFDINDAYKAAKEAGDEAKVKELEPEYERLHKLAQIRGTLFTTSIAQSKEKAASLAKEQHDFIVDGTGGVYNNIRKLHDQFKELGYETAMIFVHVELETSLRRNRERGEKGGRTLRDSVVKRNWENVHMNEEKYKELFGNNFFYVNAEDLNNSLSEVVPAINDFMRQP